MNTPVKPGSPNFPIGHMPSVAGIATPDNSPLTPAELVVRRFGGTRRLARLMGRHASTISRWTLPKDRGGTGGLIPSGEQRALLALAAQHDIELSASELILGGPRDAGQE